MAIVYFLLGLAGILFFLLVFALISFLVGGGLKKVEKPSAPVKVDHDYVGNFPMQLELFPLNLIQSSRF